MKPSRMTCADIRRYMHMPKWMRRQWKHRYHKEARNEGR